MGSRKWGLVALVFVLTLGLCSAALGESGQAGDRIVSALLGELGEAASDPWEQAIYLEGTDGISQDGETVTFALRAFDPKLKSLPSYSGNEQAWLDGFFENVSAHDLTIALKIVDGEPEAAGVKSLKSAVTKAAKAAKSGFDQKSVRVALAGLLLPTPTVDAGSPSGFGELSEGHLELVGANAAFDGLDAEQFSPLFYAQSKQSLSVKGGPHALLLSCTGADPAVLVEDARKALMAQLSKVYKANAMTESEIADAFAGALAEKSAAIRKQGGVVHAFSLDIDALMGGDAGSDYTAYVRSFDPQPALSELIDEVGALPDAPALDFPKSGRISGSKSGTKVILKTPKDDVGRYIQMRDSDTDEVSVDMFIRPGGSATVYVPKGMYYLLIASGETWYGIEGLFGERGGYSRTDETEVLSKKYYHTLTLNAQEGDISVYGANPSAFRD